MNRLNLLVAAFLDALLWTETDDDGVSFDSRFEVRDIDADTVAGICADCAAFLARCETAGVFDFDALILRRPGNNADGSAGHDFLLTRNGHGAGFWDGDWEKGDELTEIAQAFPSLSLYVGDDGKLYGCAS